MMPVVEPWGQRQGIERGYLVREATTLSAQATVALLRRARFGLSTEEAAGCAPPAATSSRNVEGRGGQSSRP
jgi:hypothetical protein